MSLLRMLAAAVALALALTWLLFRSMQPSDAEYAAVQRALVGISAAEVRLQADLLSLRGGLLHDYDPMVADIAQLRFDVTRLREASNGAGAGAIDRISDSIDAEESLAETFKSANALAQNSFAYFTLLSDRLARSQGATELAARTGAVTASVLQLSRQPTPDAIAETNQRLADLAGGPAADLTPDVASLVLHGRLLVELLPTVDGAARRLPALLTFKQRGAVRAIFLERQKAREGLAGRYRFALFGVAILFLGSLVEVGRRLRNGTLALRERVRVEHRLAETSNIFIGCQPEDIRSRIRDSLEALGKSAQSVRTYVMLLGEEPDLLIWTKPDIVSPPDWPGALMDVIPAFAAESGDVFSTADFAETPPPAVTELLQRYGVDRWSCVKLFDQDELIGLLVFERAVDVAAWHSDMTSPLRLTGMTMSNALHRERLFQQRMALEEKVQRAKRLETVGLFASGIAHNFNNLLGVMLGHAEIVADQQSLPDSVRDHAQRITEAGARAGVLVQSILNYGRRNDGVRRPVAIEALAAETVALLAPSLPVTIEYSNRVPDGGACVVADPTQMQQVLVNLIRNAAQASEGGTPVRVSVETTSLGRRRKLSHGTLEAGSYVRLCVDDEGVGIPADVQKKLFQPFFTTRPAGTGLGLATAAEVVRDLGGAFDLHSAPGQGTTFAIWLPLGKDLAQPIAPSVGRGEVIMVVTGQPADVTVTEDRLAALGFEPIGFTTIASALAALRRYPERFDLVLVGRDLPVAGIADLAEALRGLNGHVLLAEMRPAQDDPRRGGPTSPWFDASLPLPLTGASMEALISRQRQRRVHEPAE